MRALPSSLPVLVTGASSGIGDEFARQLAERGHDLVVVARRTDRLEQLAEELGSRNGVAVTVMTADLEQTADRERVAETLGDGRAWILVNNAGFGTRGRFHELNPGREAAQVLVNVTALHQLTAAVLPGCVAHGDGGVINLGSTAAFQPIPHMATYAATKAFVLHFTEAIAVELRGAGVRVTALCPGPVHTEFGTVAGNQQELERAFPMTAHQVVRQGLRAFDRNHTICVPGLANQVGAVGGRLVPRSLVRRVLAPVFAPR